MAPDLRKYIWDAKEAAARALRFTAGKSLGDYLGDELLRSAVERQFLILGEALGRVRQLDPDRASRIADLNQAVPFATSSLTAVRRSRAGHLRDARR